MSSNKDRSKTKPTPPPKPMLPPKPKLPNNLQNPHTEGSKDITTCKDIGEGDVQPKDDNNSDIMSTKQYDKQQPSEQSLKKDQDEKICEQSPQEEHESFQNPMMSKQAPKPKPKPRNIVRTGQIASDTSHSNTQNTTKQIDQEMNPHPSGNTSPPYSWCIKTTNTNTDKPHLERTNPAPYSYFIGKKPTPRPRKSVPNLHVAHSNDAVTPSGSSPSRPPRNRNRKSVSSVVFTQEIPVGDVVNLEVLTVDSTMPVKTGTKIPPQRPPPPSVAPKPKPRHSLLRRFSKPTVNVEKEQSDVESAGMIDTQDINNSQLKGVKATDPSNSKQSGYALPVRSHSVEKTESPVLCNEDSAGRKKVGPSVRPYEEYRKPARPAPPVRQDSKRTPPVRQDSKHAPPVRQDSRDMSAPTVRTPETKSLKIKPARPAPPTPSRPPSTTRKSLMEREQSMQIDNDRDVKMDVPSFPGVNAQADLPHSPQINVKNNKPNSPQMDVKKDIPTSRTKKVKTGVPVLAQQGSMDAKTIVPNQLNNDQRDSEENDKEHIHSGDEMTQSDPVVKRSIDRKCIERGNSVFYEDVDEEQGPESQSVFYKNLPAENDNAVDDASDSVADDVEHDEINITDSTEEDSKCAYDNVIDRTAKVYDDVADDACVDVEHEADESYDYENAEDWDKDDDHSEDEYVEPDRNGEDIYKNVDHLQLPVNPKRKLEKNNSISSALSDESAGSYVDMSNATPIHQGTLDYDVPPSNHSIVDDGTASNEEHVDDSSSEEEQESEHEEVEEISEEEKLQRLREKKKKKAFQVAQELMTSERIFVEILELLNVHFRSAVDAANNRSSKKIIEQKSLDQILFYLPQLQDFNQSLLKELEDRIYNWETCPKISDIILNLCPYLKIYSTTYILEFDKMTTTLDESCKKSPQFASVVKEFEKSPMCANLQIRHHMLKPIQRIPQYKLLLQDYIKYLDEDSEEYQESKRGLALVSEVASHANNSMKQLDNFSKMLEIQDSIMGHVELVQASRTFIKEGELLKHSRKGKQSRMFFLFNDKLLYCIPMSGQFKLKYHLPLVGMKIIPAEENFEHEFSIRTTVRSFTLYASTLEEREDWCNTLNKAKNEAKKKKVPTATLR